MRTSPDHPKDREGIGVAQQARNAANTVSGNEGRLPANSFSLAYDCQRNHHYGF